MPALEFILKNPRNSNNAGGQVSQGPTPNTINGLHSTDIVVTTTGHGIYILSGGAIAAHLLLSKIATWNIQSSRVTIYSLDEVPLELTFLTSNEATNGLVIIENAINNLP